MNPLSQPSPSVAPKLTVAEKSDQGRDFTKCTFSDGSVKHLTWGQYQLALHGSFDANAALRYIDRLLP